MISIDERGCYPKIETDARKKLKNLHRKLERSLVRARGVVRIE